MFTISRPAPLHPRSPHLLALTAVPLVAVVVGVAGTATTGSYWLMALTLLVAVIAAAALTADLSSQAADDAPVERGAPAQTVDGPPILPGPEFTGPVATCRILVVATEPVSAATILAGAGNARDGAGRRDVGVMVVAPEGAGHRDITDDEGSYRHARAVVAETVADLRRAGIAAAGHVGDHDRAQAVADALVLFPANVVIEPHATDPVSVSG